MSAREVLDILQSEPDAPIEGLKWTEGEKKSLWRRLVEWLKQLPSQIADTIKSALCGISLDIDSEASLDDLLNLRKAYAWYKRSENGVEIHCPTELKPGDHIAIKTKRSNFWWNHMIVADVYYDGFDVISPCSHRNDSEEIHFESDFLSIVDFNHYLRRHHQDCDMKIWEFPVMWDSLKKVVRFDQDENCPFSPEEIIGRARTKLVAGDTWDLYNHSSEGFVHEILTSIAPEKRTEHLQARIHAKASAFAGELALFRVTSFSAKNVHNVVKIVLKITKWVIKLVTRSDTVKCIAGISKAVKVLRFIGLGVGPIFDIIACVAYIWNKHQRYKIGEISKREFYKFVVKQVSELATNLIFTLFCGLCILIPAPLINIVVSVAITIIGFFVAKGVGKLSGLAFDFLWDHFCQ